jgi:beta-N-acetylhexosaminidase
MIDRIGQLFIAGFNIQEPLDEFLDFIASDNIGGVILFEKDCSPHNAAEETIRQVISASREMPFIAVDQEGGRVCRFKGAPAEYLSPSDYGKDNRLELFEEHFSRAAYYIRSFGVNLLLGPVADLRLNKDNKCLEGRTFGANPARVIPFIERAVKIAGRAGLLTCLKHFPGLGAAVEDPHHKLGRADYDLQVFLNRESLTFKAGIDAGADMVMTTHMILPKMDDKPATESEMILNLLLREKLNFDGITITDDLLMKGIDDLGSYGERAMKAFAVGHDILLFGSNFHAAKEAVEYFKIAYNKGMIDSERLNVSLDRISGIKSKLAASVII